MEEANLCSLLSNTGDSDNSQSQSESWTSTEHPDLNGQQEAIAWEEVEIQMTQMQLREQPNLTLKEGQQSPEEAENQWGAIVWPVCTIARPAASLSIAKVQWDMPDPALDMSSSITDKSLADDLDICGVASQDSSYLFLQQHFLNDLPSQEGTEKQDELLNCFEKIGTVTQSYDMVATDEQTTQEEKEPAKELLTGNNEILQKTDLETHNDGEVDTGPDKSPLEPKEIIKPEPGAKMEGTSDLTSEEEQKQFDILLNERTDSAVEPWCPTTYTVETGEKSEDVVVAYEDQTMTIADCNKEHEEPYTVIISCPRDLMTFGEQLENDHIGPTMMSDCLIHLERSEESKERRQSGNNTRPEHNLLDLKWFTNQTEQPATCEDVDCKEHPEKSGGTQQPEHSEDSQLQGTEKEEEPIDKEKTENEEGTEEEWSTEEEEGAEGEGGKEDCQKRVKQTPQPEHMDCVDQQSKQTQLSGQTVASEEIQPSVQLGKTEQLEQIKKSDQRNLFYQTVKYFDQPVQSQHLDQSSQMKQPQTSQQTEKADEMIHYWQSDGTECTETTGPENPLVVTEQPQQMGQLEQTEPTWAPKPSILSGTSEEPDQRDQSKITELKSVESEDSEWIAETELTDEQTNKTQQVQCTNDATQQIAMMNGEQSNSSETVESDMDGDEVDREKVFCLADRLQKLDGIQRKDVVKYLDKESFLKVVILIGETQERERVLQHFAYRFHQCNPQSFSSVGAVLTLTCALMLLNSDLHGQNVGKAMSNSDFVSNLDGMNEGENFSKDLLKGFYYSIKSEPLEWAVDEQELKSCLLPEENTKENAMLRSKSNPFQDVPHDQEAKVFKRGFLQRKTHADIDGKRTPWGRRSWKTFFGVLKGMVLYLQKDDYRKEFHSIEEIVGLHHSLAEQAAAYTKKPHVFRLQTADWRVFLFQASSKLEMSSWINRINLVSALHSSPPFPAAVGSQRRFCRPILPASQSANTVECQLQSHAGMLESFQKDLAFLRQSIPESRKAKAKELEEYRQREDYLQYEKCRYEVYIQVLEAWRSLNLTADTDVETTEFNLFDGAMCKDSAEEVILSDEGGLKKSHSSPSLELELAPPPVVKVRRNISERRTYRRTFIPRLSKDI
ncbi:uncharacterized protein LOC130121815 isoform X2 [Lampris incognitus]|uniref:uncharacterized protein LOC130121815 isoform X2 n=1 Tax=Lampris incognitus TaxID=2546036 RepID=UPI0024B4DDEE|nr:uncharacterized protein LOC130121815 isoform X2 [Lampris incognitus]